MSVFAGEGSILSVGTTSTVAAIAQVNNIEISGIEQEAVDAYSLDSTVKVTHPSHIPDPGSCSFDAYLDISNTQHALLFTLATNHSVLYWKVTTVDEVEYTFQGFVTSLDINGMEVDSNVSASVEVKLTTLPVKTLPS